MCRNVHKIRFYTKFWQKKRVFDPPKKKIIFFFQQKWIPHEKLDIKHVFYDYLLALNIIFKVVKRKGSTALSNYT